MSKSITVHNGWIRGGLALLLLVALGVLCLGHQMMIAGQFSQGASLIVTATLAITILLWRLCQYLSCPVEHSTAYRRLRPIDALIALGIILGTAPIFFTTINDLSNYHGDESLWLTVGVRAFRIGIIEHDATNPFWSDNFMTWGAYNPTIGKYLIGAGVYYGGHPDLPQLINDFSRPIEWNAENGRLNDPSIPPLGKRIAASFAIGCCALLFLISAEVTGRTIGLLATAFFLASPLTLMFGRRATIDFPALFFGLLSLLLLLGTVRLLLQRQPKAIFWAALTGIVCGTAIGTKMNMLLFGIIGAMALLGAWLVGIVLRRSNRPGLLLVASCELTLALTAWPIFYLSNPFLYQQPIQGTQHILELSTIIHGFKGALTNDSQRVIAVWQQLAVYGPLAQIGLPGDRTLFFIGLIGCCLRLWRSDGKGHNPALGTILTWGTVSYVVVTLWLPLNWDRYYIPLQPINAFLQAYGTIWILGSIWSRFQIFRTRATVVT